MQVGSSTVGILIGFGMMLVSGVILYLKYQELKRRNGKDKMRWMLRELFDEVTLTNAGSIFSLFGVFLLGFLIVVLIALDSLGVIPFHS